MRKSKTFEQAKLEITAKYSELTLIKFTTNAGEATFIDSEFGEFEVICYKSVLRGTKFHPKRGLRNRIEKTKKTNLERYGVTCSLLDPKTQEKIKQTNLKRFGHENSNSSQIIKDKKKKTLIDKYNVENISQIQDVKDKKKLSSLSKYGVENVFQSEGIKEKIKKTNLDRYGVEFPQQNKEIHEKLQQTNLKKYGARYPYQNKEILQKVEDSCLKRYGVKSVMELKYFKDKIIETNLKKYGVKYSLQVPEIKAQIKKTNIINGTWHNINGGMLSDFHKSANLPVAYSTLQQNFAKSGNLALHKEFYHNMFGKSHTADRWLDQIETSLGYKLQRTPEYHITGTKFHADGYDPKTKTIYEFYGDFWHGNPKTFNGQEIHPIIKKSYNELYVNTTTREKIIISLGYSVISIWECDFKEN